MTVSVASSNISRTSVVEPEKTSSDAAPSATPQLSSSPQPFTDLLVEATSKVLRDGLEKPDVSGIPSHKEEATKVAALKDANFQTRSKKIVSIDRSTPSNPIFVTPIPLIVIESAPIAVASIAPLARQAAPKQVKVDAVTTIDVRDPKPSAAIPNVDVVKGRGIENSAGKMSESPGPTVAEIPQIVPSDNPKPSVWRDQPPILTTEQARSVNVEREIRTMPIPKAPDLVITPKVHLSLPSATRSVVGPVASEPRESLSRVGTKEPITTKEPEPTSDHISSNPVRTERAEPDVVPLWPIHPAVVAPTVNVVAAPSQVTSSLPHPLDVAALVGAISRPLDEARGGYTVVIAMHPVELGHVQAVVTLHGIDLHVSITPQTQMGHDALTHAVDSLKTELSRGGVNVNVTLQDPGSQPRGENRPQVTPAPREVFTPEDSVAVAPAPAALSAGQVNLVL